VFSLSREKKFVSREEKGSGGDGSEAPHREASIRKLSERRNAQAAYTYALLEQEKATWRSMSIQKI